VDETDGPTDPDPGYIVHRPTGGGTLHVLTPGSPRAKEMAQLAKESRHKAKAEAAVREAEAAALYDEERHKALESGVRGALRQLGKDRVRELVAEVRDVDFGLLAKALAYDLALSLSVGQHEPKDVASIASAIKTFHAIARLEEGKPTALIDTSANEDARMRRLAELRERANGRRVIEIEP